MCTRASCLALLSLHKATALNHLHRQDVEGKVCPHPLPRGLTLPPWMLALLQAENNDLQWQQACLEEAKAKADQLNKK